VKSPAAIFVSSCLEKRQTDFADESLFGVRVHGGEFYCNRRGCG